MKNLLKEIKDKLEEICPDHLLTKKTYATPEEIADFEAESGLKFPEELVDFWLHCDFEVIVGSKIHQTLQYEWTFDFTFDSLERLIKAWKEDAGYPMTLLIKAGNYYDFPNRGYEEGIIKNSFYDKAWFPIATDVDTSAICIDMSPGVNGTHGQLLYMMVIGNGKSGPYYSGYTSLHALLSNYLKDLQEGRFEIEMGENDEGEDQEVVVPIKYEYEEDSVPEKATDNKFHLLLQELKDLHQELAPGQLTIQKVETATDADIAALEAIIDDKLPEEFITYLKSQDYPLLVDGNYTSYSVKEVIKDLTRMNNHLEKGVFDDGRVERHLKEDWGNWNGDYLKQVWWSKKWIPFAEDGCGNMKCIDLDPGSKGKRGQIMSMEIQDGQGPYIDRDHKSFAEYMRYQLLLVKNKQYRISNFMGEKRCIQIDSDV